MQLPTPLLAIALAPPPGGSPRWPRRRRTCAAAHLSLLSAWTCPIPLGNSVSRRSPTWTMPGTLPAGLPTRAAQASSCVPPPPHPHSLSGRPMGPSPKGERQRRCGGRVLSTARAELS